MSSEAGEERQVYRRGDCCGAPSAVHRAKERGGSPLMLADIDSACTAAGVWPYAEFSGHAHNYQRYTRTVNDADSIYGGRVRRAFATFADAATYRTAYKIDVTLMLENYDTTDYGYLRVIVNATTMRDRVSSAA